MTEECTDRQTITNCGGVSNRAEYLNAGGSPDPTTSGKNTPSAASKSLLYQASFPFHPSKLQTQGEKAECVLMLVDCQIHCAVNALSLNMLDSLSFLASSLA